MLTGQCRDLVGKLGFELREKTFLLDDGVRAEEVAYASAGSSGSGHPAGGYLFGDVSYQGHDGVVFPGQLSDSCQLLAAAVLAHQACCATGRRIATKVCATAMKATRERSANPKAYEPYWP